MHGSRVQYNVACRESVMLLISRCLAGVIIFVQVLDHDWISAVIHPRPITQSEETMIAPIEPRPAAPAFFCSRRCAKCM
jgi:hypothetical protein